jgi:hypothetical protein
MGIPSKKQILRYAQDDNFKKETEPVANLMPGWRIHSNRDSFLRRF